MHNRIFILLFCCIHLFVCQGNPANAGEYALVVGIDKYPFIGNPLNNAVSDASAVANKLKEIGYGEDNVSLKTDADLGEMEDAFEAFLAKLQAADDGSVALFYFSGHGVEFKGQNYLIPSDIKGSDVDKLFSAQKRPELFAKRTMVLNDLLNQIADVRKQKNLTVIFIIDACRERPLAPDKTTRGFVAERGLAPVLAPKGMFVMYSAGAGQQALDGPDTGSGAGHSVYTKNLLKILSQAKRGGGPGVAWMAQEVRENVYIQASALDHLQTPAYYDQFTYRQNVFGQRIARITLTQQMAALKLKVASSRSVISKRALLIGRPFQDCLNCPEMMAIEGGRYLRGSDVNEIGRAADEGPQSLVKIKSFGLSRREISNREWNLCVAGGGCKEGRDEEDHPASLPVNGVSWHDANSYAAWLSKQTGQTYRLATEAEWEFAARAGSKQRYFFGEDASKLCDYGNGADRTLLSLFYSNNSCSDGFGSKAAPVGVFRPNPFKLHGMIGNVAEWVEDCYVKSYEGAPEDGSARVGQKAQCKRVVRSGSWRSGENALRSAARNKYPENHKRRTIGIRIARDIDLAFVGKAKTKEETNTNEDRLAQEKRDKDTKAEEDRLAQERRDKDTKAEEDRLAQEKSDKEAKAKEAEIAKAKLEQEKKLEQEAEKARLAALEKLRLEEEANKPKDNRPALFTAAQVKRFSPRARKDLVNGLVSNQQYFYDAKITTPDRLVHFFTQIGLETAGLRRLDENMNYSKSTLLKVFSRRTVGVAKAGEIARKPKKVANWVYGARLGNRGRNTNDGWNYRGSGFIQLTGRHNFRARGREVQLPLEAQPELARQPKQGLNAATAYWTARKINGAADRDRLRKVRLLVNGPRAHGYKASKIWYRKAKKIFAKKRGIKRGLFGFDDDKRQQKEDVDGLLEELGFAKKEGTTRTLGAASPLAEFQKSRGLTVTGKFDEDTLYAITDPREWRSVEE